MLALLFVLYVRRRNFPVAQVIVGLALAQCIAAVPLTLVFYSGLVSWYVNGLALPVLLASLWTIPRVSKFGTLPSIHVVPWAVFFLVPLVGWPLIPGLLFAALGNPDSVYAYAVIASFFYFGYSMLLAASTTILVLWLRRYRPSIRAIFAGFASGLIVFGLLEMMVHFDSTGEFYLGSPIPHLVRLFVAMGLCLSSSCTPVPAKLLRAILNGQP